MAQAQSVVKHVGCPVQRRFRADDWMNEEAGSEGMSIRKLVMDFDTTQSMAAGMTGPKNSSA